jgi:hypothetical protein
VSVRGRAAGVRSGEMTVVAKKRRAAEEGCQGMRSRVEAGEKEVVLLLWSMERVTTVEVEENMGR